MAFRNIPFYASKTSIGRTATAYDPSVITDMVDRLTEGIGTDELTIMLTHEPQFLDAYADDKVDLVLPVMPTAARSDCLLQKDCLHLDRVHCQS